MRPRRLSTRSLSAVVTSLPRLAIRIARLERLHDRPVAKGYSIKGRDHYRLADFLTYWPAPPQDNGDCFLPIPPCPPALEMCLAGLAVSYASAISDEGTVHPNADAIDALIMIALDRPGVGYAPLFNMLADLQDLPSSRHEPLVVVMRSGARKTSYWQAIERMRLVQPDFAPEYARF